MRWWLLEIGPKFDDLSTFGDPTAYNIMFGPDKCGYTKRTHLIFNYKGQNVLKKSDLSYKQGEDSGVSHLYRMILKPDNMSVWRSTRRIFMRVPSRRIGRC